jgi:hypothetical protein
MNESEWLTGADPAPMLKSAQSANRRRTVRLFSCACCRRLWSLLPEESRASVVVAERYAGGLASPGELECARARADAVVVALPTVWTYEEQRIRDATGAAATCCTPLGETTKGAIGLAASAAHALAKNAALGVAESDFSRTRDDAYAAELAAQADLVRELFGNPFRPLEFSSQWRTDTAVALARAMSDAREFSAMPILADALQDAGCNSAELLDHCRGDQPHTLGCWAVDLVLRRQAQIADAVACRAAGV